MGSLMVKRLLFAGHSVTVWNRSAAASEALVANGAHVAGTAAEAASHAEMIITMLFDDAAHEATLLGTGGVISALPAGALHIACGTISVALSARLAAAHAEHRQQYVAAPVFGRPNVAAEGKLWIAAAGASDAVVKARPVLEPLSRGISVVGDRPEQAHAVKLAGNFMIASMIQTLSEAFVFAEAQGIDPQIFFTTVNRALFQSPFYEAYSKVMFQPLAQPGATIELGAKDIGLFRDAGNASGFDSGLAAYLAEELQLAVDKGLGATDWPTTTYHVTQGQQRNTKAVG